MSSDSGKKLVESSQQDALNALHSALDLTTNSKPSLPQQAVGQLNLSMLLPVPQYNRADKLKPIIEFLGEESGEKNRTTVTGENLPVPKDSRPNTSNKKDSSNLPVQNGITPTSFGKQNGIASSSKPLGLSKSQAAVITQSIQPNVVSTLGSIKPNNDKIQTVNHNSALNFSSSTTVALQKSIETSTKPTQKPPASTAISPLQGITEGLVKNFLSSKFGQALGKSLLDSTIEDSSYKNILAQHFSSSTNPTASPAKKIQENPDLVASIVSGLIHQHTRQESTSNSALEKNNEKGTSKLVKQDYSGTNNLSSPTVSIGNKVFSLTDLANSLLDEKQVPSKLKSITNDVESKKASRRHPSKHGNKEKLKVLNEKIATLETLSDALDALTMQLSPDEKSEEGQKQKETLLSFDNPIIQEQRHRKHHTHQHHQSDPFSEDLDMLGALLARGTTHGHATQNKRPVLLKDDKDSNAFVGITGQKGLSSADLDVLQNKINQAIEMAEAVGRQKDSAKQATSSWLPLLVSGAGSGKVSEDVGAQTREEVATIPVNSVPLTGILPSKDHELQSVQEILTGLINNAMKKGTLTQLVQRWDRSGSPFAEIAKNISLYLQDNSKPKMTVSKLGSNQATPTQTKTNTEISPTAQANLTSQLAKVLASLTAGNNNFTSPTTKQLITKAVSNILSALTKRQGLHKSNTTSRSSFETTDTLTNFKGVLLGGRINKLKPIPDSIVALESMLVAKILEGRGNKTFSTNTSEPVNFALGNKVGGGSNNKVADLLQPNHTLQRPLLSGQGKAKLTYSSYETKNVSRTLRNNTLMDFMKSMEEHGGPEHPTMANNSRNNPGDKHSQVKPHVGDLMSIIAASLLELEDNAQGGSSKSTPKLTYKETGKEPFLHGFPNDHKMSDFSRDDAVLQAPSDFAAETNSSNKRLTEPHNSTQSPTNIIMLHNNTKGFSQSENRKGPEKESHKVDLGDQTVTLTLETVDDASTPAPQTNEGQKTQTGLRNNKVPHYLNLHSAITLGKINATNAKNIQHSVPQGQIKEVPTALSSFRSEAEKPEMALPSEGDGKLTTIFPSTEVNPGIVGDFQTKSEPELPLGLQMDAIGRIAETDNKASVTPADLSTALTSPSLSDLSSSLASKTGETKSSEDKILPMSSDLTSLPEDEGGETERIVSKASHATVENPGIIHKPSFIGGTPKSEARPTSSEVREMATSIKALLKILTTYSKKLRLESDDMRSEDLPTRSSTASRVNGENIIKEGIMKSPSSGITTTKYNDNMYANLPPSSITLPNYVDSGVFENIHEQPNAEANNYNWNFGTPRSHPQIPSDINPTKTSLEPRLDADQWRPANEASVTEDFKDLNLPSIEDDPTVRAVQNLVAEENSFLSQKRKAIEKHEPTDSIVKSQLPSRPGVFGRNTIPKHKGNHRNQTRVEHKNKFAYFGKRNNTRKSNVRGRDEIPRQSKSNDTRKSNARGRGEIPRQSKRNDTRRPNGRVRDEIPSKHNGTRKTNRNVRGRDEIPRQSKHDDTRKSNRNVRGKVEIPQQSSDKHSLQNAPAADIRKPATQGDTSHHGNKSSSPPGMMGDSGNTTQSVSSRDKIPGKRKKQNTLNDSAPAPRDTKKIYKIKHDLGKAHRPNSNSTGAVNTLTAHDRRNTVGKPYGGDKRPHGLSNTKVTGDKRNLHPMKLRKTYEMSKGNVTNLSGTVSKLEHVRAQKATYSTRL